MSVVRVRSAFDFVAAACVFAGYVPVDSVAFVTTSEAGDSLGMSAVLRLPREAAEIADFISGVVQVRETVAGAQTRVVTFGDREAAEMVSAVVDGWWSLPVVDELFFCDGVVHALAGSCAGQSRAVDLVTHPIVVAAAAEHGIHLRTRAELAAWWKVGAVVKDAESGSSVLRQARAYTEQWREDFAGEGPVAVAQVVWSVLEAIMGNSDQRRRGAEFITGDEAALLLAAATVIPVRDALLGLHARERSHASEYSTVWGEAARRVPGQPGGGPMTMAAACAHLAGHGAVANCAIEGALQVDSEHSLCKLLDECFQRGLHPNHAAAAYLSFLAVMEQS